MRFASELELTQWAEQTRRLWLFLDYDGTLADFAPTPETATRDPQVIEVLERLAGDPRKRVAVISGRKLADVQMLLPVNGLFLGGTYGLEVQTPSGEIRRRADYQAIRPIIERVKSQWLPLIAGREGFFLEDKGWALALHARFASEAEAASVLARARQSAQEAMPTESFRLLGGQRFMEIAPGPAHKGETVTFLLHEFPWPGSQCVYIGDDDKDEAAFGAIHAQGGVTLWVSQSSGGRLPAAADWALDSPQAVRRWLAQLNA